MNPILKTLAIVGLVSSTPVFAKGAENNAVEEIAIMTGQNIQGNNWSPSGYMRLWGNELTKRGRKFHWIVLEKMKTEAMLARVDAEVIAKKPAYLVIIPGTADYNPARGDAKTDLLTQNLKGILEKLKAANIKPVLVTSHVNNGDLSIATNKNAIPYNDVIRTLSKENGLPLIDLVKIVDEEKKIIPFDGNLAAYALVHQILAGEILRTMGYGDAEVAACRQAWLDTPGAIQMMPSVSNNTYDKLKVAAKAGNKDVTNYISEILHESVK